MYQAGLGIICVQSIPCLSLAYFVSRRGLTPSGVIPQAPVSTASAGWQICGVKRKKKLGRVPLPLSFRDILQ